MLIVVDSLRLYYYTTYMEVNDGNKNNTLFA